MYEKTENILKMAKESNTAVISFICMDYTMARSVVYAAEAANTPAMVMLYPEHVTVQHTTGFANYAAMVKELAGICRNNLPLSDKPELNWIGGVGTGAYGAVKAALKHPEVFSACIAMDGIYDMGKICERAKQGETVVCHNEESLKAVFGDIDHIKGSDNDVFALAEKNSSGRYYITGAKGSAYQKEAVELTRILKDRAVYEETDETEADFSCITTMKKAVAWLCGR